MSESNSTRPGTTRTPKTATGMQTDRPRVTVCLFASHPLLRAEFERLLPSDEFRLIVQRPPARAGEDAGLVVPRASVYAVEAQAQASATQALVAALVGTHPAARVVVLAEAFREEETFPLLRLGIKGLLSYSEVGSHLARTLSKVASGGFWVPRSLLSRFVDATVEASRRARPLPSTSRLSRREREVVDLLLENLSNKEIARRLGISERTAKFHVSNLLAKFRVKRRADLILLSLDPVARSEPARVERPREP